MNNDLRRRLNDVLPRIRSHELLTNKGLGNEIGFYIFDYPPEDELEIRNFIHSLIHHLTTENPVLRVAHVNLFELVVEHLKRRDLLGRALEFGRRQGDEMVRAKLRATLKEEAMARLFVEQIDPDECDVALMSGVGSAWTLLRSHTLLNNLHPLMHGKPLVVFYPGIYDGQRLSLFGKLKDDNYYRAFRLVP